MEVRGLTVGQLQENCYLVRADASPTAVMVDPGEEPERLLAMVEEAGVTLEAILLTHCHFDHIGAVAPVARATGAPVYVPALEREVLADIDAYVRFPGFGPFESYEAEHTVEGGEALELAGLTFDVRFTPGHSPGHVTYAVRDQDVLLAGDVLFRGSVGRTDLPGGDMDVLLASIAALMDEFPAGSQVFPGHMEPTTLGDERATNPFLRSLAG